MEESEEAQEIETLKAIWPELQDRPPVWNSPAVAIPVCPLGSLDAESSTRVTLVVIYNPRYPKVPPRLELESARQLADHEVAKLKHSLDLKAKEMSGMGVVMVHDLLVLTNDFLSEKDRRREEGAATAAGGGGGSLFQKMHTEEQKQRKKREEEERAEEKRQREEEARLQVEQQAAGEAQWALVREKLEQERERAASMGVVGALEGVIPESSMGYSVDGDGAQLDDAGGGGKDGNDREGGGRNDDGSSESDDGWMNEPEGDGGGFVGSGAGGVGVEGTGGVRERSSWYRSQFKELENLGKGGFGTVVKVRNRVDRRLYAVKKVGLDPFDKETNRKIRREVTTISTLIHKNIVRYYQAWLEGGGGGGAYPAAVEEEHSDAAEEEEGGTEEGSKHNSGTLPTTRELDNDQSDHNDQSLSHNDQHQSGDEDDDDNDQSEEEAGIGFFQTPTSSSAASRRSKASSARKHSSEKKIIRNAPDVDGQGSVSNEKDSESRVSTSTAKDFLSRGWGNAVGATDSVSSRVRVRGGRRGFASIMGHGDNMFMMDGTTVRAQDVDGAVAGGDGGGTSKKSKRQMRKETRRKKKLLLLLNANRNKAGRGEGGSTREGASSSSGRVVKAGDAKGPAIAANRDESLPAPTGALWAKPKSGATSFGSACSSSADGEPVNSNDGDWSDERDGATGVGSGGSWGSDGGDYRAKGEGKLVSDAEFFHYCGSPERARQGSDPHAPPIPASWSSEDALMQLYEETRRDRPPAMPSTKHLAQGNRSLPGSPTRDMGAGTGGLRPLPASRPPLARTMRSAGERQFLYIQMEYCENTLRHLIDHGEVWKEEQRCWRLFRQMLEGVEFIHSKGIIHRDLTPPNVFLDAEENVKLGDFGLATSKKVRDKVAEIQHKRGIAMSSDDESVGTGASVSRKGPERWTPGAGGGSYSPYGATAAGGGYTLSVGDGSSVHSVPFPSAFGELSMSDTSQLTDGVGTGPYIAPEQGARFGQYNHKADMWSLGVILFEMLAPRFSTLMERAEVMTALRSGGQAQFPQAFEDRVPENAKKVIRWLLMTDAEARPTAAELLSSNLLPPKLEVEATFLREALRVMGNPESDTFQAIVKALLDQETAEHVEHWYDHDPLKTVSAQIPLEAPAVSFVRDALQRVFETHGAMPVAPPSIRPKPPPSLAPPLAASRGGLVHFLDDKGGVVTLPGNLTAPFARFVARSGLTRLKRYQIDRIFHAGGGPTPSGRATETWEADFDIVASSGGGSGGRDSVGDIRAGVGGGGVGVGAAGQESGPFEVAEAEAVLVVSQMMGSFDSLLGPWFLRLGNVKMSQAILELCGVPQDARPTVLTLLARLTKGSIAPEKAWSELEGKDVLSAEAFANVRPFLHYMGKDPFQALVRLEGLVQRIPAVKTVTGLATTARRRELTRKEAVRTKRSLRAFRDGREGLLALVTALGRLGLILLPLDRDNEAEAKGTGASGKGASKGGGGGGGAKGSRRRRNRRGDPVAPDGARANSADSRTAVGDRSDGDSRGVSSGRGSGGTAGGLERGASSGAEGLSVARTGGELEVESWKGGERPAFVVLDLGLTQRHGNYASGTIFQAVLFEAGSLKGVGRERYSSVVAEGGRYDDLIARHRHHLGNMTMNSTLSGGVSVCAVGVRFAVEKIANILITRRKESHPGSKHQPQHPRRPVDVVVCAGGGFEPQGLQERVLVAARLWAAGIRAEYLATDALVAVGAGRGGGLEGAVEACLSAGIPFVVVVRPHTLVAKKAVKVLSVMEKGGGQLEVPLDKLAQHVRDGLAALDDPSAASTASSHRAIAGTGGGHHGHHPSTGASSVSSSSVGGVTTRLALVDRGQTGVGLLDREKMSRHEYKSYSTLERRIGRHLDAAIAGPDRVGATGDGEGPLVLATEASFGAVRSLSTAYMLWGGESKAVSELLSDHGEKKYLRNLLTALQEVEDGKRKQSSKGQGQGQGKGGQPRQVFVYSTTDEMMDLVTFSSSGGSAGLLTHQGSGAAGSKGGRGMR